MQRILVDSGPLIAWFNRSDQQHDRCRAFFDSYSGTLLTTWLVLGEVCFLLPGHRVAPFLDWVADGGATVFDLPPSATADIAALMRKYADRPMDLADASLVWLSARTGIKDILTIDHADFAIYRDANGHALTDILS